MLFRKNNSFKENKHKNKTPGRSTGIESVPFHDNIAPYADGDGGEYIPRHMEDIGVENGEPAEFLTRPDGSHIAPNGAVIRDPMSSQPEIEPDHEYTEEKEDLNLLIM